MTCETCRWFDVGRQDGPLYDGRCARRAPRVRLDEGSPRTVWPDVMLNDRCGEWTMKKAMVPPVEEWIDTKCPKCGAMEWSAPVWRQEQWLHAYGEFPETKVLDECLVYTCRCGYKRTGPCKDAEETIE
jgi:hypothetical protein